MTERSHLIPLLGALSKARVLIVGDVMLDHFHYGTVERISPEAPIPVLKLERQETMLGGAGNVVRNLLALGAGARFITVTGNDAAGREVARSIKKLGLKDSPIIDKGRQTSTKTRYMAGVQQVMCADQETTHPLPPRTQAKLIRAARGAMRGCKSVVLSDYAFSFLEIEAKESISFLSRSSSRWGVALQGHLSCFLQPPFD